MSHKLEIERHDSTMSRTRVCNPLWKLTKDWQNLPEFIFGDMMMMMGLNSLEDLHRCRQVCQSWNVMIFAMTKYKKDKLRRKADDQAVHIREKWVWPQTREQWSTVPPNVPEIITAAFLAQHGLLGSLEIIWLWYVDLASVPAEHLASLTSCVTERFLIINVSNFNIRCILGGIKCKWLCISRHILSSEETQDLVMAMESGVEGVNLGGREKIWM